CRLAVCWERRYSARPKIVPDSNVLWHTAGRPAPCADTVAPAGLWRGNAPKMLMAATRRWRHPMAIFVSGGHVLNRSYAALERADILIESDRIQAVGGALAVPSDAHRLDATGCLILPGLVNAHTHAHNNLLRGLADNWTLEELLNHGPALNGNRTPEDQYLSAAIG